MKRLRLQQRPRPPTMPSPKPRGGWLNCFAMARSRPRMQKSKLKLQGLRTGRSAGREKTLALLPARIALVGAGAGICPKPRRRRPRMPKAAKRISWPPSRDIRPIVLAPCQIGSRRRPRLVIAEAVSAFSPTCLGHASKRAPRLCSPRGDNSRSAGPWERHHQHHAFGRLAFREQLALGNVRHCAWIAPRILVLGLVEKHQIWSGAWG
jgi:hypothetical protein